MPTAYIACDRNERVPAVAGCPRRRLRTDAKLQRNSAILACAPPAPYDTQGREEDHPRVSISWSTETRRPCARENMSVPYVCVGGVGRGMLLKKHNFKYIQQCDCRCERVKRERGRVGPYIYWSYVLSDTDNIRSSLHKTDQQGVHVTAHPPMENKAARRSLLHLVSNTLRRIV